MTTTNYWDKIRRQRISRRRMLAVTGAGAAGLAIAAACGDSGDDDTGPTDNGQVSAGTPVYGGRHQIGTAVNIDTLDPHVSIAGGVGYFPRIYNVLMAQSPIKPELRFDDQGEK